MFSDIDTEDILENQFEFNSQLDGIKSIVKTIDKLKSVFPTLYDNIMKDLNIDDCDMSSTFSFKDLIILLIFGENKDLSNCSNKLDFNKNKTLLKSYFLCNFGINKSAKILKQLTIIFSNFFIEIIDKYDKSNQYKRILNDTEFYKLQYMIDSFVSESSFIREKASNLITITNYLTLQDLQIKNDLNVLKSDTIKRFYFTHTYDIKNNVKIFNKDKMVYGEINNTMKLFDDIFSYIFGDIVSFYNTLSINFNHILSASSSTK